MVASGYQSDGRGRTAVILSRMIRTIRLVGLALAALPCSPVGAQSESARFGDEIHVFSIEDEVRPAPSCATLFVGSSSIRFWFGIDRDFPGRPIIRRRSEEHTSELQSLMRISYAVFCLKKKNKHRHI